MDGECYSFVTSARAEERASRQRGLRPLVGAGKRRAPVGAGENVSDARRTG
jgi:hypothetical protein